MALLIDLPSKWPERKARASNLENVGCLSSNGKYTQRGTFSLQVHYHVKHPSPLHPDDCRFIRLDSVNATPCLLLGS